MAQSQLAASQSNVMLLCDEPNSREVTMFPLNQQGEDLMMGAPGEVSREPLKELSLRIALTPRKKVAVAWSPKWQGKGTRPRMTVWSSFRHE
jgi:hypothetical protein